jgi:hypothetical protein
MGHTVTLRSRAERLRDARVGWSSTTERDVDLAEAACAKLGRWRLFLARLIPHSSRPPPLPALSANGPDEAAGSVLPYCLGMPARKRPTPQDAATARGILLDGMAQDTEVPELAGELAPLHPRDNTFPGEVLLQVAADALDWCGASRADPLALEGLPERFLPECAFRGRQNKKL